MDINFTMGDILKSIPENILEYFLSPKQSGYDVPKTLLYALLLVGAAYAVYRVLKRLKIGINRNLAVAVSPYVALGSALRVLQDAGTVDSYFFVTPGIYVLVAGITISALMISYVLQRKMGVSYYKTCFIIGIFTLPFVLSHVIVQNIYGGLLVAAFISPWVLVIGTKRLRWAAENKIVTLLHMFDATTTFVSLHFFGYLEQHVLPNVFINSLGPISFIPLKALVIISTLVAIDRFSNDKEFNTYIKIIIGILGAATGIRDFISLLAFV